MIEPLTRIWSLLNRRRFEIADELDYHPGWIVPRNFSSDLHQDLHFGRRVLRKSVGFTLTATLVLGLGIGVPLTALRGSLNDIPERWMRDPGSLAILTRRTPHSANALLPYPAMQFFADRARSFRSLMGMAIEEEDVATQAGQHPERIPVAFVTANYFEALGSPAGHGRVLSLQIDGKPNAECAAILSNGFWQRRLGGEPAIVGRQLLVNGKPVRVVGITPAGFFGIQDDNVSIWLPMEHQPEIVDGSDLLISWQRGIRAYARLMPGLTETSIRRETVALMAELREQRPADFQGGEWMSSQSGRKLLSPENLL
jgi:hypothetical protein